jgi:hypothetical protein
MKCWHCNGDLVLDFTGEDFEKFYHCANCEKWYESYKEKVKINGAVPVRFVELDARPLYPTAANAISL